MRYTRLLLSVALASMLFSALTVPDGGADGLVVRLRPGFLNTLPCKTVTGKIYIQSAKPATYDISISGVPDEWVGYPESVRVEGEETVNYMVNPKESGSYRLMVTVRGAGETEELEGKLWVGPRQPYEEGPGEEPGSGISLTGGVTGMFVMSGEDQAVLLSALVSAGVLIAALFSVLLGYSFFKREVFEEEKVY